jgi:hypothetical protein
MPKLMVLMKRKEGISHDDFRKYYESKHAPFAVKCFGHLFAGYRRNFPYAEFSGKYSGEDTLKSPSTGFGQRENFSCDGLMEIWFDDQESMDRMFKILEDVKEAMAADEDTFIDRDSLRVFAVDEKISNLPSKV